MTIINPALNDVTSVLHQAAPKEMISVSTKGEKTFVRINYSSMDVIQSCLRKAQYLLEERWKPRDESVPLIFGTAFHKALEVFYSGSIDERKMPKLETMEMMAYGNPVEGEETDLMLRSTRAFITAAKPLESLPEADKHSIVNGVWILHSYFKAYLTDPYEAIVKDGEALVEKKFSLVVYEDEGLIVELFGTIDVILKHVITGEIFPADHKTVGFLSFGGNSYFDREKPSHQYTGYLLGAQKIFGINTNKFLVNIVEKKTKPKTDKAKGVSFPRQITERTEDDFTDFKEALVYSVRQYLAAKESGIWPMGPTGSCTAYGSCSYRSICSAPKSMRKTIIQNKFMREETT